MTWFMAGAAALSAGTSYLSASSSASSAVRNLNAQTAAEGDAVVRERLNTTIRNSYNTAFSQMQLGLQKRQLAQQGADISAAGLAARANADVAAAATGSVGASTQAVVSDIEQKIDAAHATNQANFENALENYNNELQLMVLNTDQSAPQTRRAEYNGPSSGEMFGMAVLGGVASFASNYAMKKMSLGLGPQVPSQIG